MSKIGFIINMLSQKITPLNVINQTKELHITMPTHKNISKVNNCTMKVSGLPVLAREDERVIAVFSGQNWDFPNQSFDNFVYFTTNNDNVSTLTSQPYVPCSFLLNLSIA